ncbi:MAG TPA: DsrE family protein [Bryobacteraceae bacterium]|nr:DsrE family protein [Bryobacteraceae bacterium]
MKQKLVVILTQAANSDRSTIAFTVANASLSAGMDVMVFLASDGADLVREHAADRATVKPFMALDELIGKFISSGGVAAACGSCCQFRGLQNGDTREGIQVVGVSVLVDWLAAGATAISL